MAVLKLINNSEEQNEKNLCFVNASLQLLHSIEDFRDFFKSKAYRTDLSRKLPISDEVSRIFRMAEDFRTSAGEIRRLVGQYHRRVDICNGSQQDMEEFTRLLSDCLEKELESVDASMIMNKFKGREMNLRLFLNTTDGKCQMGHLPRSEPEMFNTIKLTVPETDTLLSLNNLIHEHYSVSSQSIMMKCSDCCKHLSNCPQTKMCKLREAAEKKCLLSAPKFLYIQLMRFTNTNEKIKSIVLPENVLVLPNEDKYKLVSIGNHMGSLLTNGHYTALVKCGSTWVMMNDDD